MLNSEAQQSTLFTVRMCVPCAAGDWTRAHRRPQSGAEAGGQVLYPRPGPSWTLYYPETKLGEILQPGATPACPQRRGPGGNEGQSCRCSVCLPFLAEPFGALGTGSPTAPGAPAPQPPSFHAPSCSPRPGSLAGRPSFPCPQLWGPYHPNTRPVVTMKQVKTTAM